MTRHCPNCGEEGLRDKAQFCDNCGAKLVVASDHEATLAMPETPADDEATRFMPEADTPTEDGATMFMPEDETVEADEATRFIPDEEAADDDGATRPMREGELAAEAGAPKTITRTRISEPVAPPKSDDFKTGHMLQNRYRLDKALGKGGFGAAYLAEDVKLKRRCVVKQMLAKRRSAKELEIQRANFEREAKLLAELNDPGHPNIPEIYDYFSDSSGNYLVMKYIEGRSLKDALEQSESKLPWRETVRYAIDICSALNYMHAHGREPVMHRDIKPANILLGDDGRVWLVDFGLAKANPVGNSSGDLVATQASGSLGYSPLEQWLGQAVPTSDIYALGATLHHLVTGINPLDAYTGEFHIKKLQEKHAQFSPVRQLDRTLPKALEDAISRAVAADPNQRPTALQLQQQLEVTISGAQGAALYTFKNGKSAKTVGQLVDLCEKNRREAEGYLYNGDFERWFLLINRNDLAEAAVQAVKQGKHQKDGLEKFLRLIVPNLFLRRLSKAGWHVSRGALQFGLSAIIIVFLLAVGGSYLVGFFIQQSIGSFPWNFAALDLTQGNHFTEADLTEKFRLAAGPYLDKLKVEVQAPDQLEISATLNGYPLKTPVKMGRAGPIPYFDVSELNNIPLWWVGDNISQGINEGVAEAFRRGPVDLTRLLVLDGEIVFNVVDSQEVGRPPFATSTPTITPTPTPTATPTPVNVTLVVVFNELDQDVILEIDDQTWEIAANDSQAIQMPPGTYDYRVEYKETEEIAAQGTKTWTLNQAYRLHIGLEQ